MDLGWKFGVSLGPLEGEPEIQGGSVVSGGRDGNSGWVWGLWGEGWKFRVGLGSLEGELEIRAGSGVSGGRDKNSGWAWGLWGELRLMSHGNAGEPVPLPEISISATRTIWGRDF